MITKNSGFSGFRERLIKFCSSNYELFGSSLEAFCKFIISHSVTFGSGDNSKLKTRNSKLFRPQPYHRANHLFEGNAAVLEGVFVIIVVVIVVVGVKEKYVSFGKNKG